MPYTTLISCEELNQHLDDPDWVIIDCRFSLVDTEQGRRAYRQSHIPGAQYAHLDEELSGPIIPGQTGRHPLPDVEGLVHRLSNWGIDDKTQIVAYDSLGGAIASRVWWLARWLGHQAVALLDGGWPAWQSAGYPTQSVAVARPARVFRPKLQPEMVVDTNDVLKLYQDPTYRLLDARSADRYRGENETLDPIAGRIPGAISAPFADNLDANGYFRPAEELRRRYETLLEEIPLEQAIAYCGSGVTAAHNLLAMAQAGLEGAKLYAGSWSEWIAQPETKGLVKTGE